MPSEASEKKCAKQTHNGVPQPEPEQLPCPRCESTNTKFCYYNNYNFSQPRHFCKACRRYWTHGGTLRDIPFGGGTRKNAKRSRIFVPPTNAISPAVPSYEYRGIPTSTIPLGSVGVGHGIGSALPFIMDGKGGMSTCGSFTSLLNIQGFGPGVGPMGYGLGRAAWPFAGGGGDGGGGMVGNTWQLDSCEGGFAGGDCFSM